MIVLGVCHLKLGVSPQRLQRITDLTRTSEPLPNGLSPFKVMAATAAHQKLLHMTFGGK